MGRYSQWQRLNGKDEISCVGGMLEFLSCVRTLTRDIDIAIMSVHLSVCPSVRLSVTFQY